MKLPFGWGWEDIRALAGMLFLLIVLGSCTYSCIFQNGAEEFGKAWKKQAADPWCLPEHRC